MSKFNLKPINKQNTAKQIAYKEIKNVILNGYISPNEIFTELKLAESLQTSRTPVREALLDLIKEGLIVTIPHKGMMVRKVKPNEIEQIFLLRNSIESEVIRKLTSIITEQQLQKLKNICKEQQQVMQQNDEDTFIKLDQSFHILLTEFVHYELIEQVLLNLHNLSNLIGLQAIKKDQRMQEVLMEHLAIISAMEKRNTELAAQLMIDHLNNTKNSLKYNAC